VAERGGCHALLGFLPACAEDLTDAAVACSLLAEFYPAAAADVARQLLALAPQTGPG
jgi:hypothetical protein